MGILVYLTFKLDFILKHSLTKKTLLALALVFLQYVVSLAFKLRFKVGDLTPLAIVLMMVMVGGRVHFQPREFKKLCTVYCVGTVFLGMMAILTYLGSFSLSVNANAITGKNQVGAIVAVGGGMAFYLSLQPMRRKRRLLYLGMAALILVILVVVRCRTALVGYVLFCGILLMQRWTRKQKRRAVMIGLVVYICFFSTINHLVVDSLLKSTDLEDDELTVSSDLINQLSTNRHERNVQAIQFIRRQPLEGALFKYSGIKLIHNYVLLRLVRYGIILAIPYLWIYFVYMLHCIRGVARKDDSLFNMGSYILIIPMFCSLLEPSAPFGPGTVEIMPFLLCGFAMQRQIYHP
jgi:O-antigen ligase